MEEQLKRVLPQEEMTAAEEGAQEAEDLGLEVTVVVVMVDTRVTAVAMGAMMMEEEVMVEAAGVTPEVEAVTLEVAHMAAVTIVRVLVVTVQVATKTDIE